MCSRINDHVAHLVKLDRFIVNAHILEQVLHFQAEGASGEGEDHHCVVIYQ